MLRWTIYAAVFVVAIAGLVTLVGFALPKAHQAQRRVTLPRAPAEVFAVLTAFDRHPEWRQGVRRVTIEGAGVGAIVREENRSGRLALRIEQYEPPVRLVMRIVEETAFGGTWTYELRPIATGTELTITEDGEIYNPLFRVIARFVFGHDATLNAYVTDLESALGSSR